jgi:hypothetical protein
VIFKPQEEGYFTTKGTKGRLRDHKRDNKFRK